MTDGTRRFLLSAVGAAIGLINGILGGGGGALCVFALLWLLRLKQKQAQATTLAVILPITLLSASIYILGGKNDWSLTLPAAVGVTVGGAFGAKLLKRLKTPVVELIFALLLVIAGAGMI